MDEPDKVTHPPHTDTLKAFIEQHLKQYWREIDEQFYQPAIFTQQQITPQLAPLTLPRFSPPSIPMTTKAKTRKAILP